MATETFRVEGRDSQGNQVVRDVAVTRDDPPTTPVAPVQGTNPASPEPLYGYVPQAKRLYRLNLALSHATPGTKQVHVTDDPALPATGGAANATVLRNALIAFYEGSGSAARRAIEYHFAGRNEIFNEYQTGDLPPAVVDTFRRYRDVIYETVPTAARLNRTKRGAVRVRNVGRRVVRKAALALPGDRRWPNASLWLNGTTWTVTNGTAASRWKPVAVYIDGVCMSEYPPRREAPPDFPPYSEYFDAVLAMMIDWRNTYPNVKMYAIWETGIPIHRSFPNGSPNNGGTTNWTRRPRYFCGGRDSGGINHEGVYNYAWRRFAVENGFIYKANDYWNEQSNPEIPNPFKHDRYGVAQNVTQDDLISAHFAWNPYTKPRLPDL